MTVLAFASPTNVRAAEQLRLAAHHLDEADRIIGHVSATSRVAAEAMDDIAPVAPSPYALRTIADILENT